MELSDNDMYNMDDFYYDQYPEVDEIQYEEATIIQNGNITNYDNSFNYFNENETQKVQPLQQSNIQTEIGRYNQNFTLFAVSNGDDDLVQNQESGDWIFAKQYYDFRYPDKDEITKMAYSLGFCDGSRGKARNIRATPITNAIQNEIKSNGEIHISHPILVGDTISPNLPKYHQAKDLYIKTNGDIEKSTAMWVNPRINLLKNLTTPLVINYTSKVAAELADLFERIEKEPSQEKEKIPRIGKREKARLAELASNKKLTDPWYIDELGYAYDALGRKIIQ